MKNSKITITFTKRNEEQFSIFIAQWGPYKNLNNGQDIQPKEYNITEQKQTITSDIEGVLYLSNKSQKNEYKIEIEVEKGIKIPTFIINKTTNQEFYDILAKNSNSPFIELIGNHVFATFQMKVAEDLWVNKDPKTYDINQIIDYWDQCYTLANKVHGLDVKYDGIAYKFPNKIHITNPESKGYGSATSFIISMHHFNTAKNLLKESKKKIVDYFDMK